MTKENRVPRLTKPSLQILQFFAHEPRSEFSGAEIRRTLKISTGTLYPILLRFEEAGLLKSRWEDVIPQEIGRPRRRLYRITADGINVAQRELRLFGVPVGALGTA